MEHERVYTKILPVVLSGWLKMHIKATDGGYQREGLVVKGSEGQI